MDPQSNILLGNLQVVRPDGPELSIPCNPRDSLKSILERLDINLDDFFLFTEDGFVSSEATCSKIFKVFLYPKGSKESHLAAFHLC